ncbi:MAG: cytochrome b/b6 domain-containing protein [Rhizobacter sp.]|nr:cytochrome b/b6 domain-containing protein [Rhizobacter sp.]
MSHALLYLLMVALPMTGYVGASYSKAGVAWFGVATPRWTAPDPDLAEAWFAAHAVLLWTAVAVVLVHAAGAVRHLIERDGVFERMSFAPRR